MELSKSELRATRNSLIIEIMSNSDCGLQEISRLFNLSEGYLKNYILKDVEPFHTKVEHSLEQLKEYRASMMTDLKQQHYTEKEILYIFNCKSSNEDLRSLYLRTYEEYEILSDKFEKFSLAYKFLEDKNKSLELDNDNLHLKNKKLSEEVNSSIKLQQLLEEIKKDNCDLKEKLLESQQANKKSQEDNNNLTKELENLHSIEQENSDLKKQIEDFELYKKSASKYYLEQSEKENSQNKVIRTLESELKQQKQLNQKLSNENVELQSQSSCILYLQADLSSKDNIIQSLKSEIESLKSDIENLSTTSTTDKKKNMKYEKVYDRELIKSVYQSTNFNLKATYEELHNQGIFISYRHLQTILKEEKVYKHTYKVKRKNSK